MLPLSVTVNVMSVWPESPSSWLTSVTDRVGTAGQSTMWTVIGPSLVMFFCALHVTRARRALTVTSETFVASMSSSSLIGVAGPAVVPASQVPTGAGGPQLCDSQA